MNTLDTWLKAKYGIETKDLPIAPERIFADASRYSKEERHKKIPLEPTFSGFEKFAAKWISNFDQSKAEDRDRKDGPTQDPAVAESIAAFRLRLEALGKCITLDQFPYHDVLPSAQPFVLRAVKKEISRAIGSLLNLDMFEIGNIYSDKELEAILPGEFKGS